VAEQNLETAGLLHYFDMIVGSDDVQNYKPHPESIEVILQRFSFPRIEAWMIGDATTDLEMGEAAKVCTCAVTWGAHSVDALANLDPTSILHSPAEFLWLFDEKNWQLTDS
jgi:phosphoglycolate phosphatase-like HAD superfamily hydrolase